MTIRAQVVFQGESGLAEDQYVNNFHFNPDGVVTTAITDAIHTALVSFYNDDPDAAGAGVAPGKWLANSVKRTALASRIKMYDLSDAIPRVPVHDVAWTLTAAQSSGDLPAEVAVVASYQGDPESGIPRSRQRGRFFLGPLIDDALASAAPLAPVVSSALITSLNAAMVDLRTASLASATWDWVVFSGGARDNSNQEIPYLDRPLLAPMTFPVAQMWVDDAFDTQRRRGRRALTKVFATV